VPVKYSVVPPNLPIPPVMYDIQYMHQLTNVLRLFFNQVSNRISDVTTTWDDLRFPVQGINPSGTAAPPSVDTTLSSFPGTLLFSGSAENVIAGTAQMPHRWKRESEIYPHIHWSMPTGTSDAVTWEFYYRHLGNPGDVAGAWVGPLSPIIVIGNQSVTDQQLLSAFAPVLMTDKKESAMINWQIRRQGATDAASGQARLYEFDIHFESDKDGTDSRIPE